jgi:hypothetical protein
MSVRYHVRVGSRAAAVVLRISRLDRLSLASEGEHGSGGGKESPLELESALGTAEPQESPQRAGLEGVVSRALQAAAALVHEEQAAREARKAAEDARLAELAASMAVGSKSRRRSSHEGGPARRDSDLLACLGVAPAERSAKIVYKNASISLRLQEAGSDTYIVDGLELLPFKVVCTVRIQAPPDAQEGAAADASCAVDLAP